MEEDAPIEKIKEEESVVVSVEIDKPEKMDEEELVISSTVSIGDGKQFNVYTSDSDFDFETNDPIGFDVDPHETEDDNNDLTDDTLSNTSILSESEADEEKRGISSTVSIGDGDQFNVYISDPDSDSDFEIDDPIGFDFDPRETEEERIERERQEQKKIEEYKKKIEEYKKKYNNSEKLARALVYGCNIKQNHEINTTDRDTSPTCDYSEVEEVIEEISKLPNKQFLLSSQDSKTDLGELLEKLEHINYEFYNGQQIYVSSNELNKTECEEIAKKINNVFGNTDDVCEITEGWLKALENDSDIDSFDGMIRPLDSDSDESDDSSSEFRTCIENYNSSAKQCVENLKNEV